MIDLGCDPGTTVGGRRATPWRRCEIEGMRVSIDTFDPVEAALAAERGPSSS